MAWVLDRHLDHMAAVVRPLAAFTALLLFAPGSPSQRTPFARRVTRLSVSPHQRDHSLIQFIIALSEAARLVY